MAAVRSPHADPGRPTLRQRGADLKADLARAARRPKPAGTEAGAQAPLTFAPIAIPTPVRSPSEWGQRLAPHLLAVHMADRMLRLDRSALAAFIEKAGDDDDEVPVAMLDSLELAAGEFELLAEMTRATCARCVVAAGDVIGEAPPVEAEPSAQERAQPAPSQGNPEPSSDFEEIAAGTRAAADDALADERVSSALRAAVEAHRDATLAMLLEPDTSNEATEARCAAVEATGAGLCAVPARSLADVRCKLALLLPEMRPDVNGSVPAALLEDVLDDVRRLAAAPTEAPDPLVADIIAAWAEWAALPAAHAEDGDPLYEQVSARRHALLQAAEVLPATRENLVAKALALAWIEYVDVWERGRPRADYATDGRLALDIDAIVCGQTVQAPAAGDPPPAIPEHDLAGLTEGDLARLYDAWNAIHLHIMAAGNGPCFWGDDRSYTPAGDILDREYDRASRFLEAIAQEARRRRPGDAEGRRARLHVLVLHAMERGGTIGDPALRAELAAAWER